MKSSFVGHVLLVTLFSVCIAAQGTATLRLRGIVTDSKTHLPIAGAVLSSIKAVHNATTDGNGFFSLVLREGTKAGDDVRVHIEKNGYRAEDVTEAASENVIYQITLSHLGKSESGRRTTNPEPQLTTNDKLFLDCRTALMPERIAPSGDTYVLATWPGGTDGLADYFGPGGSQTKWNNDGKPEWAYRCELTNYTSVVALNIQFSLKLTFLTAEKIPEQPNSIREGKTTNESDKRIDIPRIDLGPEKGFVFYVWNCCLDQFVRVSAPAFVTVSGEPGSRERLRVPLMQATGNFYLPLSPHRNPDATTPPNPRDSDR